MQCERFAACSDTDSDEQGKAYSKSEGGETRSESLDDWRGAKRRAVAHTHRGNHTAYLNCPQGPPPSELIATNRERNIQSERKRGAKR